MHRPWSGGGTDDPIQSAANRIPKYIRSLRQRKMREAERAFVVEGFRAIADGISAGFDPRLLVVREGSEEEASRWLGRHRERRVIAGPLFDELAETTTPQGAVAVFPMPELPIPAIEAPFFLVLDQVRDPGNVGTLIRTAAAAGVTALFLTEGSVDPFNGKAVRAGVGAHFRLPISWLTEDRVASITQSCPLRVIAEADSGVLYDEIRWDEPSVLIVGSEAHGVSAEMRNWSTAAAAIPLQNGVESLNAAMAAGIILFEAGRQRRTSEIPRRT
jgi:TrmH family RNA methyltransferase